MANETEDIHQALRDLTEEVTALRTAITGDGMGNDGLAKSFRDHASRDENRYEAQVRWNNDMDKRIAWYVGGAAGIGVAIQVVFSVIPSMLSHLK